MNKEVKDLLDAQQSALELDKIKDEGWCKIK